MLAALLLLLPVVVPGPSSISVAVAGEPSAPPQEREEEEDSCALHEASICARARAGWRRTREPGGLAARRHPLGWAHVVLSARQRVHGVVMRRTRALRTWRLVPPPDPERAA